MAQHDTGQKEEQADDPHPRMPVRRFDIFAEYNRQKAIEDGIPEDEAAGYGLWVAKVVASRSFGRSILAKPPSEVRKAGQDEPAEGEQPHEKWRSLGGAPQTDDLFEKEIVRRMGADFYDKVFAPAIKEAVVSGKRYESIRDILRKQWNF